MKKIGLVIAGGVGSRIGADIPKQFLKILDKPVIIYTLETLNKSNSIDDIYVVCENKWSSYIYELCKKYSINKFKGTFERGNTGIESIWSGMLGLKKLYDDAIIVIQDANRCLTTIDIIDDGIAVCAKKGSCISILQQVNAQVYIDKKQKLISRDNVLELHRPEFFLLNKLYSVYCLWKTEKYKSECPTAIMLESGENINFCKGNSLNTKITFKEDLILFEGIINAQKKEGIIK